MSELRKSGIDVLGDISWGSHYSYFYQTTHDLLDTLVPYFMAGLRSKEFCLWIVSNSELLTVEEAKEGLRQAMPELERYLAEGSIEIVTHDDWFLNGKTFDLHRVANRFKEKLDEALARGYAGMRVNGSPAWLQKENRMQFCEFEEELNRLFPNERIIASCTFPLETIRADEIFDITQRHQFAIAKRYGQWEIVETPELKQAKDEIKKLNKELEQRIVERTQELTVANEELRKEIAERRYAETLLQTREQEFRAIVENAPDHIARYDREFRRTYVNPALAKSYDLPVEALIGKPMFSIIQDSGEEIKEDELAPIRQRFTTVFETGKSNEFEISLPMPQGRRDYSVRLFPEFDFKGSVVNVLSIARDITERKQLEDTLRRNEDRIRFIIDTIPIMAWTSLPDGTVDFANQRWLDYAGKEAIKDPNHIIHPEDLQHVTEKWFVNKAAGKAYEDELRLRRTDGEYRWFLVRTAPLYDERGNIVKWYGVSIDIEDSKRAEERIKQSEAHLAEAQRLTKLGSWDFDIKGDKLTWSDELYNVFGTDKRTFKETHGSFLHLIDDEDREFALQTSRHTQQTGDPFAIEYHITTPQGEKRIIQEHGYGQKDVNGKVVRLFGTAQNITERKKAEEALQQSYQEVRQLTEHLQNIREEERIHIAREIHDELGQQLSALKMEVKGLNKKLKDADEGTRQKIADIIDLLETTVISVRRISSELRPSLLYNLGLIAAMEWHLKEFEKRSGIKTIFNEPKEELELPDPLKNGLFRIFQESLTNVSKHANASKVKVTLEQKGQQLILKIEDDGQGFEKEKIDTKNTLGIVGMRERSQMMGGNYEISSIPGKGTVVIVTVSSDGINNLI